MNGVNLKSSNNLYKNKTVLSKILSKLGLPIHIYIKKHHI